MGNIPSWLLRLLPASAVVLSWYVLQDNIRVLDKVSNPYLFMATVGVVFLVVPLLPYLWSPRDIKRRKDFVLAALVSGLGSIWSLFIIAATAWWEGFSLN